MNLQSHDSRMKPLISSQELALYLSSTYAPSSYSFKIKTGPPFGGIGTLAIVRLPFGGRSRRQFRPRSWDLEMKKGRSMADDG